MTQFLKQLIVDTNRMKSARTIAVSAKAARDHLLEFGKLNDRAFRAEQERDALIRERDQLANQLAESKKRETAAN